MQRNKKHCHSLRASLDPPRYSIQSSASVMRRSLSSTSGVVSYPAHCPGFSSTCLLPQCIRLPCIPCSSVRLRTRKAHELICSPGSLCTCSLLGHESSRFHSKQVINSRKGPSISGAEAGRGVTALAEHIFIQMFSVINCRARSGLDCK